LEWRVRQLRQLRALLTEHDKDLAEALYQDLHKGAAEAHAAEIDFPVREIDHTLDNLEDWLYPESLSPEALTGFPEGSTAGTRYDPLGVVLVIAPWNY
ncbi:aldehyde dehydrogenase family protein, partial [Streptomyces daliensis]|nr:aldehyde dehydrogenase family protein [Streptomyces daliensis]